VPDAERVALAEFEPLLEYDAVALSLLLTEAVALQEDVAVLVPDSEPVGLRVLLGDALEDVLLDSDAVCEELPVTLAVDVAELVALTEEDGDALLVHDAVALPVLEAEIVLVAVCVLVPLTVALEELELVDDALPDAVALTLGVELTVLLPELDPVDVKLELELGVAARLLLGVKDELDDGDTVTVDVVVVVIVTVTVIAPVWLEVALADTEGVYELVSEPVPLADSDGDCDVDDD
jgi:hypothetical protein